MKLIDNWKDCWKMWSVRINVIIGLIIAGVSQFPDIFLHLWVLLPDTITDKISNLESTPMLFLAAIILSTLARLVKQDKLYKPQEDSVKKEENKDG